jgi:hypothetical protein
MAKDKPQKNTTDSDMILEIRNLKRLFAFGCAVVTFLAWQLFSANAQQDIIINEKVNNPHFSLMLAQVQTESRRERDVILKVVASNSEKTESNSKQIAKVDSKVSKILGIVELLVDKIKDDNDD